MIGADVRDGWQCVAGGAVLLLSLVVVGDVGEESAG
jgi:hypothetical protein